MKKHVVLTCMLLSFVCLYAKDKVCEKPYFIAKNTQTLEVVKVILKRDTTILDMKIFGSPTDKVRMTPTVVLPCDEGTMEWLY